MEELLEDDGLSVMAAGLTWQRLAAVLVRLQLERRKDAGQRGVMLVLGCRDWQRSMLKEELLRLDPGLQSWYNLTVSSQQHILFHHT